MHTEIPALKEHAAINHLKHKSSLRNASHKNSPPESSSTQINHVSQESQGKSGLTDRGVEGGREAFSALNTLRRRSLNQSRFLHVGEMLHGVVTVHHVQLCIQLPIFKGSSYLCTQYIMHRPFNPVCNQQCLHATSARIEPQLLWDSVKASDTPFPPPLQRLVLSSSCQRESGNEDKIRPGYLLSLPSI